MSELEDLVEGLRWAFYAGAVLTGSVRVGIAEELSGTELDLRRRRLLSQISGAWSGWTREDVTLPATACTARPHLGTLCSAIRIGGCW